MLDLDSIARLYANVLHEDIGHYGIKECEIRKAIQTMATVYLPGPMGPSLQSERMKLPNYNQIDLRCAYLHKFAPFHTALVLDAMKQILEEHALLFKQLVTTAQFKLCCIGGGPGTDAIGILAALGVSFGIFNKDVTIVDIMGNWKFTFEALMKEIVNGNYSMQKNFFRDNFQWNYISSDLVFSMSSSANKAISDANFISMIKFVSSTACKDTKSMVTKIFRVMKPGALVLFIDNAGGGFHQLIRKAANNVGLITIFGPLKHYKYSNEALKTLMFGYTSCCLTTVSIHLLQKPRRNQQTKSHPNYLQHQNSNYSNVSFRKPIPAVNNNFFNSKLDPLHDSTSSGKNDLNKIGYSNEVNCAKCNLSPDEDKKLDNKLPITSPNQVPKNMAENYNQVSYSYISTEPVSPINNGPSESSVQSEQNVFHESSNNSDDGCCCVIS